MDRIVRFKNAPRDGAHRRRRRRRRRADFAASVSLVLAAAAVVAMDATSRVKISCALAFQQHGGAMSRHHHHQPRAASLPFFSSGPTTSLHLLCDGRSSYCPSSPSLISSRRMQQRASPPPPPRGRRRWWNDRTALRESGGAAPAEEAIEEAVVEEAAPPAAAIDDAAATTSCHRRDDPRHPIGDNDEELTHLLYCDLVKEEAKEPLPTARAAATDSSFPSVVVAPGSSSVVALARDADRDGRDESSRLTASLVVVNGDGDQTDAAAAAVAAAAVDEEEQPQPPQDESIDAQSIPSKLINAILLASSFAFILHTVLDIDHGMTRGWTPGEITMRIPLDNWASYESSLSAQPIATKTIINVVIYLLGDWLSQTLFQSKNVLDFDAVRTLRNGFIGMCFGPLVHEYYEFSDYILPVDVGFNRIYKILMDQTIYLGVKCSIYIMAVGVLSGDQWEDVTDNVRARIKPIMFAAWKFWPLIHCITYGVVPARHRILWVNSVDLVWNAILASKTSGEPDEEVVEDASAAAAVGEGGETTVVNGGTLEVTASKTTEKVVVDMSSSNGHAVDITTTPAALNGKRNADAAEKKEEERERDEVLGAQWEEHESLSEVEAKS